MPFPESTQKTQTMNLEGRVMKPCRILPRMLMMRNVTASIFHFRKVSEFCFKPYWTNYNPMPFKYQTFSILPYKWKYGREPSVWDLLDFAYFVGPFLHCMIGDEVQDAGITWLNTYEMQEIMRCVLRFWTSSDETNTLEKLIYEEASKF